MTDDDLELWKRVRRGDISARNELVVKNAPLVSFWVRRIKPQVPWADRDDLLQDGTLGLIRAIENFRPERGWEFSTFARFHIYGKIFDSPELTRGVPRRQNDIDRKVRRAHDKLAASLGRKPTSEEIGKELQLNVDQVKNAIKATAIAFAVGIVEPNADEESPMLREPAATTFIEDHDSRLMIEDALSRLSEREQDIVIWYHWYGESDSDIAMRLATTQAAVSKARQRAMKKLRNLLSSGEEVSK